MPKYTDVKSQGQAQHARSTTSSKGISWGHGAAKVLIALAAFCVFLPSIRPADASHGSTPMSEIVDWVGAATMAELGIDGTGVDVAVIDTGVEPVRGLDGHGKVIVGPDLSFEAGLEEWYGHDTYGHGTVMASIIAGNDGPGGFQGMAPGARIVSVKVADNTGAADVSQVIAALDWVVEHGRQGGLNVRVINLSYVTDSQQSHLIDPLAFAVERAWKAGYVVVVAAGNHGNSTELLGNPAADPYVIAVAAADEYGEAEFSNQGSHDRVPDVLAPGDQILGLAAPGSRLVQENPNAFIDGRYLRGSGTSQATAIVSGAAALLIHQRPELTPDQVKALLILGTVDDKGLGNGIDVDPIKGMTKFFDLLDLESSFRSEARSLRAEAAALRSRAAADLEQAVALRSDAAVLRAEAAVLVEEAEALEQQAKQLSGDQKSAVEAEFKAIEQRADDRIDEAKTLEESAKDLEEGAEKGVDTAIDLEEDAVKADLEADEARYHAEHAVVPDHVKASLQAESLRADAEALRAEAAALRVEAAPIFAQAAERYADAEPYWAEAERGRQEAILYFDQAKVYFAEAKRLYDEAKVLEHQAKELSGSEAKQLKAKADALTAEADARTDLAEAIESPGVVLADQAKALETEAKNIEKDAKNIETEAKILEDQATSLEIAATAVDTEAAVYEAEAEAALAELQAGIAELFANWDGTRLGDIQFDDVGGAGLIDIERSAAVPSFDAVQTHPPARGGGSLEAARGTNHVTLPDGSLLTGEVTFTGNSWSGNSWSGNSWSGNSWSGNSWSGNSWSGSSWSGAVWSGNSWSGASWSGNSWSGNSWSGNSWSGNSWSGNSWSGSSWSGSSWS